MRNNTHLISSAIGVYHVKMTVFSTQPYDRAAFNASLARYQTDLPIEINYRQESLTVASVGLAKGADVVCVFVNDCVNQAVLQSLAKLGVTAILLRCAGFNNVDLVTAQRLGLCVARVPAYSPEAVAEHAVALLLAVNRNIHLAHQRVRTGNFLLDGLEGSNLHGKTVGIVGLGKIGVAAARIFGGFGMRVIGSDPLPCPGFQQIGEHVDFATLLAQSDIIDLHCPLTEQTKHLINRSALAQTKPGLILINTSRGPLIHTPAVIDALKSEHLKALAMDVYEQESGLFFQDHSKHYLADDDLVRLMSFPNVLMTGHQAFLTQEALANIAETTLHNLIAVAAHRPNDNWVLPEAEVRVA